MKQVCEYCGKEISQSVMEKRKYTAKTMPKALYCNRECLRLHRKASGFMQQFSQAGNAAQAQYKQQHGKAPGVRGGARPRQTAK
jgi:hypothetical protein